MCNKSESELEGEEMERRRRSRQMVDNIREAIYFHEDKYHKEQLQKEANDNFEQQVKDGIIKEEKTKKITIKCHTTIQPRGKYPDNPLH